jgi:acyl CoA:acetate/3-ketoacid CoA transferase beta subunit
VFSIDERTKRLVPRSIHPGVTLDELREATGFALELPRALPLTEAPTDEELRLIREVIDPGHRYTTAE